MDSGTTWIRTQTGNRRQRAAGGPREHQLHVRLSAEEAAELTQRAKAAGVVRGRYLIEAALARPHTVTDRRRWAAQLAATHRVLRGLATNVNQLAKVGNSTGQVPAGTGSALAAIEAMEASLVDVARSFGAAIEASR